MLLLFKIQVKMQIEKNAYIYLLSCLSYEDKAWAHYEAIFCEHKPMPQ